MPRRGRVARLDFGFLLLAHSAAAATTSATSSDDKKEGLSTDGLSGVIVGVVSAVVAIIGLGLTLRKRYVEKKEKRLALPPPVTAPPISTPAPIPNRTGNPAAPSKTRVRRFLRVFKPTSVSTSASPPTPHVSNNAQATSATLGLASTGPPAASATPPANTLPPPSTAIHVPPPVSNIATLAPSHSSATDLDWQATRDKWLRTARRRVQDGKNQRGPKGVRWQLVEVGERIPNDALSFQLGRQPGAIYIGRCVSLFTHLGSWEARMCVVGFLEDKTKAGAVNCITVLAGDDAANHEPPYELLCGPVGAVEAVELCPMTQRLKYKPEMLLVEDSLDDYPSLHTIKLMDLFPDTAPVIWWTCGGVHLVLKDRSQVSESGCLLIADIPSVKNMPGGVETVVEYQTGGNVKCFGYKA